MPAVWIGISTVAQAIAIGVGSVVGWVIRTAGTVVAAVAVGVRADVLVVVIDAIDV